MNWFVLAALAGIASNFFNIVNRSSLKEKGDSTVYAWWFELMRFSVFFCLFLLNSLLPKNPSTYLWLTLLGLVEVVSIFFLMRSHQLNQLTLSTFIVKLQLIWTAILAFIVVGERLNMVDYSAFIIILIGIFIAIYSNSLSRATGFYIALIFSLCASVISIIIKITSNDTTTPFIMVCMSLPALFILPLFIRNAKLRITSISDTHLLKSFFGAASNIIAMFLSVNAIRLGSASKVAAVYQGMMIISLMYSVIVLKEKKQLWQKITGMGVILLGLYVLSQ